MSTSREIGGHGNNTISRGKIDILNCLLTNFSKINLLHIAGTTCILIINFFQLSLLNLCFTKYSFSQIRNIFHDWPFKQSRED